MPPIKKALNQYPSHNDKLTVYDFVINQNAGVPKIIDFMNTWASEMPQIKALLLIRYEDMQTRPEDTFKQIVEFIGTPGTEEQIHEAVAFAAYENMKKLEEKKLFRFSGRQMVPTDRNNPDSFKVRRAKVGGYRDYFDAPQAAQLDAWVERQLSPLFGYQSTFQCHADNSTFPACKESA